MMEGYPVTYLCGFRDQVKKLVLFLCVLCLFMIFPYSAHAESALTDTDVSMDKLERLLAVNAPEGLYIITHSGNSSLNVLSYWKSSDALIDGVDTAVHESFHEYTKYVSPSDKCMAIYTGKGKKILVYFTDLFDTSESAVWIDNAHRTFRFNTYVLGSTSAANKLGVYGMLNELAAYGWGMDTMMNLFPYFRANAQKYEDWQRFILEGENNHNAYAEFIYWILNYMEYARIHHKNVYKQILANKNFLKAFRRSEKRFRMNIRRYENYYAWIGSTYNNRSYNYVIDNAYERLCGEINSSKYAIVRNRLGLAKIPSYR